MGTMEESTDQELARAEVPVPVPAVDRIEAYEVDEGVVLYDPQNPSPGWRHPRRWT
jgi:hypothetical protein